MLKAAGRALMVAAASAVGHAAARQVNLQPLEGVVAANLAAGALHEVWLLVKSRIEKAVAYVRAEEAALKAEADRLRTNAAGVAKK